MKPFSKILLPSFITVFCLSQSFASELTDKKNIVEKHLKNNITFDKKLKVLLAFQSWTDKELKSNADKLSEEDLTQVMQFSTLLKVVNLKQLTSTNCNSAIDRVIDEDINPATEELSGTATSILNWLKLACSKQKK